MQTAIAFAHFCAGRYEQAATWSERAVTEQSTFAPAIRVLIATNAALDRMDDAAKGLARLREINAVARISELWQWPSEEPGYFAKYAESLRKGGFAE